MTDRPLHVVELFKLMEGDPSEDAIRTFAAHMKWTAEYMERAAKHQLTDAEIDVFCEISGFSRDTFTETVERYREQIVAGDPNPPKAIN